MHNYSRIAVKINWPLITLLETLSPCIIECDTNPFNFKIATKIVAWIKWEALRLKCPEKFASFTLTLMWSEQIFNNKILPRLTDGPWVAKSNSRKYKRQVEQFYNSHLLSWILIKPADNHWTLLWSKGSPQETSESALGQRDKCIKVLAPFGFPRCPQLF